MSFLFIFVTDFLKKTMLRIIKYIFFSFSLTILLNSCKDSKEYRIDPAFTDYLQRFENEAANRGHNFNPHSTGLIIEFASLSNSTAGLTNYETPIRIEIDQTYWNDIAGSAGADMMKEELIFHELGHGLLGRSHLNTTLSNGDWKSIMCGGTKVGDRAWNINYRGVRRKYYVDELFDENTTAPEVASLTLAVDSTGFTQKSLLTFSGTGDTGNFLNKNSSQLGVSLENGRLMLQNKTSNPLFILTALSTPISINSDFSYELGFYYPTTNNATNQYGLIFGHINSSSSGLSDSIEYFSINNNQKMYMGNNEYYSYFTELTESSIVLGTMNKLKVQKIGTFLYYFINNSYCYMNEINASADINQVGFSVPELSTIYIDNFKVSQRTASAVNQQKINQNQFLDIRIQQVNKSFQHILKNK